MAQRHYLDDVALKGLQLAERDFERGALDEENLKRINTTVKEIMDDLADFEPRRWFRKAEPVEKEDAEEAQTGLASLSTMDEVDEEPLTLAGRGLEAVAGMTAGRSGQAGRCQLARPAARHYRARDRQVADANSSRDGVLAGD